MVRLAADGGGGSGTIGGQLLNVGPVYRLRAGDTLAAVAARFRTTVRALLALNPDVGGADRPPLAPGQELCLIPCLE